MEKEMAPHSSTLAWKISWMEEPGGLQSMGLQRVGHDWATSLSLFTLMLWRRKCQPTPVFLPGESQGWWSLVGLSSVGSHRVGHDWSDLAGAAAAVEVMEFRWAISNLERWCCESAALNMPANLENSAVATGLEKVSFHSNPKERQCQKMLKLWHNCIHFTC